jgi:BirA family biotin operon repressor/biotin-[acetyl-CoA-carboxylase] ligase
MGEERSKEGAKFVYPSGTLVLCETQTGGKGRLGRQWASPAGGIFMSLILRLDVPFSRLAALPVVTGLSVASAVRTATGLDAFIKWPNDVLVSGKKICGILCEARLLPESHCVVAGIGINANQAAEDFPAALRESASSIRVVLGDAVDRNALIAGVLNDMEKALHDFLEHGLLNLQKRLNDMCAYMDEPVALSNRAEGDTERISGVFRGVDSDGQALIEIPGQGIKAFPAGDLSLRPV